MSEDLVQAYIEKYQNLDVDELEQLYFDKANNEMTPIAGKAFMEALKAYRNLPAVEVEDDDDDESYNVLAVTDFENNSIVFLRGDGSVATDINGSDVFYVYKCPDVMAECCALMRIMNENDEEDEYSAAKNIARNVLHWFGDSLHGVDKEYPEEFEGVNIALYVYSEYCQCPWDPTLEVFRD